MGKVISIVNNKGGVAKTTTAFNLSCALSRLGKRVLMIDLDPQSSLTIYCGLEPLELKKSIYDVLTNHCEAKDALMNSPIEGIDIIPASIDLSAAEVEIVGKIGREFILSDKLAPVVEGYDYIVIDNSPSLGVLTVNSLIASDYVISPSEPTYLALRGLEILTSTINQVVSFNGKLKFMGVLITMYDPRTSHHAEVIEELKKSYPTFKTMVKRSIRFSDSCLSSQSIFDYAGDSFSGAQAYLDFAKEVIDYAG